MHFKERYGPWAIIAGATQGIGEQFSHQLAAKGLNILMIARGQQGLDTVSKAVREQYKVDVETLALDLSDPALAEKLAAFTANKDIGLLVYNAIYSHIGEFLADDINSKMLTIDVNCKGPLLFLDHLLPPMKQRQRGGVILMSSMSGWQGSALVATYAASKAFNTVLAESLWEEMRHYGVDVITAVAGATKTPNFNKNTPQDKAGSAFPMEPKAVVAEALTALEKGQGPTRVTGIINKSVYFLLLRMFTRRFAVKFISNATRKLYSDK